MLEEMPTSLNIAPLKERIKWIDKLSIREIAALQYMNGEPENFRDYDMEKMAKSMYIVQFASADDFLEKRTLDSMMGKFGNNRIYAAIVDEKITCMSRLPDDEVRIWVANLIFDPTLMHIDKLSLIRNKYGRLIRSGNIDSPITSDTKYIEEIAEKIVDFAIENGYAHPEASNEQKLKLKVWYDTKELEEKLIELCRNGELNYSAYENIKVKIQNSFESGRSEKYWCIPADPASLSETDRLKYYDSSDPLNYFYRYNMDAAYCLHIHKNELKRYLQEHNHMLEQNSLLNSWLNPRTATVITDLKLNPQITPKKTRPETTKLKNYIVDRVTDFINKVLNNGEILPSIQEIAGYIADQNLKGSHEKPLESESYFAKHFKSEILRGINKVLEPFNLVQMTQKEFNALTPTTCEVGKVYFHAGKGRRKLNIKYLNPNSAECAHKKLNKPSFLDLNLDTLNALFATATVNS